MFYRHGFNRLNNRLKYDCLQLKLFDSACLAGGFSLIQKQPVRMHGLADNRSKFLQELPRIDVAAAVTHFKVQVRPGRITGAAAVPDQLTL